MRLFRTAVMALCSCSAFLTAAAHADYLPVINGNFQTTEPGGLNISDPVKGNYSSGQIPGWTVDGSGGQYQPTSFTFANGGGSNIVAYSNGGTISQYLGSSVVDGDTYTLTVMIGNRADTYESAFDGSASLVVDGVTYAATGTTPPPGFFSTYTATFTGTSLNADDSIEVVLSSGGVQGDFDNVFVEQTGATPEPSSLMLLGTGILGLGGLVRRRMTNR